MLALYNLFSFPPSICVIVVVGLLTGAYSVNQETYILVAQHIWLPCNGNQDFCGARDPQNLYPSWFDASREVFYQLRTH